MRLGVASSSSSWWAGVVVDTASIMQHPSTLLWWATACSHATAALTWRDSRLSARTPLPL